MSIHIWIKTVVKVDSLYNTGSLELEKSRDDDTKVKLTAYFHRRLKKEITHSLKDLKRVIRFRNGAIQVLGNEKTGQIKVVKHIPTFSKLSRVNFLTPDGHTIVIKTSDLNKALGYFT